MRISKLDGLRGLFSLMIVLFHYREAFLPDFLRHIFFIRVSYTFVDFFFVLSGYVIAYNYNSIKSFPEFTLYIKKRFTRLFPLLLLTTSIALIFDLIGNFGFPQLVQNVDSVSVLFKRYVDTLLFTNSTPILGKTSGINGVSWSISSEMVSYIVFGIVSLLAIGKRKNIALAIIILACAIFTVYHGKHFNTGDYGFVRGLISFNIGYFVWLLSLKKVKVPNFFEIGIPIFLLAIFYILHHSLNGFEEQMFGLGVIPLFFGISIWILIQTNGIISKILSSKPLIFLGDISYSVYLNHAIIVLVIPKIVFGILKFPQNMYSEIGLLLLTIAFILVYSYFTFKVVELKGGSFLKRMLNVKPNKPRTYEHPIIGTVKTN